MSEAQGAARGQNQHLPHQTHAQPSSQRLSRDEMNLAEFPLTVLSTRIDSNVKTLEFKDTVKGKNGEIVNRQWIITGADKFGLPTASDDEVLLGLLKLTVDAGVEQRKVFFTRYELLKILRWSTEGRSYSRLQKALDRLSGVRIKTVNGFYDNETKLHSTRNFGIIDGYEINDGRGPNVEVKPSFFTWSETIFKSFQVGFIKKLDLDFLLDLKSAVSKRLYRYLDKHFWYRSKVQVKLFTLAHEKIGISRNYAYASQIRQHLDPAIEELVKLKFLLGVEYVGKGSNTEIIFYAATGARHQGATTALPPTAIKAVHKVDSATDDVDELLNALVSRGLKPAQATKILEGKDERSRRKIAQIITHFDELLSTRSPKISRSPVGFLYRAVENADRFVLPSETTSPKQAQQQILLNVEKRPPQPKLSAARTEKDRDESQYLAERKMEIEALRREVEPDMLAQIRREVEGPLARLKSSISPERFKVIVEVGIDNHLAKLFALPTLEEWRLQKSHHKAKA